MYVNVVSVSSTGTAVLDLDGAYFCARLIGSLRYAREYCRSKRRGIRELSPTNNSTLTHEGSGFRCQFAHFPMNNIQI